MKIAGRKNDGAWFRANKAIKSLDSDEKDNLAGTIAVLNNVDAYFNALLGIQTSSGVTSSQFPDDVAEWSHNLAANGIPRQVWMGRLSYTTYRKVGGKYIGSGQVEAMHFGKELRKAVTRFLMVRRQLKDIGNTLLVHQGNPGGLPNADVNT